MFSHFKSEINAIKVLSLVYEKLNEFSAAHKKMLYTGQLAISNQ